MPLLKAQAGEVLLNVIDVPLLDAIVIPDVNPAGVLLYPVQGLHLVMYFDFGVEHVVVRATYLLEVEPEVLPAAVSGDIAYLSV